MSRVSVTAHTAPKFTLSRIDEFADDIELKDCRFLSTDDWAAFAAIAVRVDGVTSQRGFICRAANAHEAMLAALKAVQQVFVVNGEGIFKGKIANDIKAAIALAEGRTL